MERILILYNNRTERHDLTPGWGFSAFIEHGKKKILFDTGTDKLVLEHNAKALGIDLNSTDVLVLSHEHCDHIGAITSALHKDLELYHPASFSSQFRKEIDEEAKKASWHTHAVARPTEILPGIHSTGQLGNRLVEQGVIVTGKDGPVLVTGCAHPGIVEMARGAMDIAGKPPHLVLGGFHLLRKKPAEVQAIATELKQLGVKQIGPCHCTGERAMAILREAFGDAFIEVKAGSEITL